MTMQPTKTTPGFPRAFVRNDEDQGCALYESHFPEDLWLMTNPAEGFVDSGWYCEGCAEQAAFP